MRSTKGLLLGLVFLFFIQLLIHYQLVEQEFFLEQFRGYNDLFQNGMTRRLPPQLDETTRRTTALSAFGQNQKIYDEGLQSRSSVNATRKLPKSRLGLQAMLPRNSPKNVMLVDLPFSSVTRDKRIIYFLHIHKSAGTAICVAAKSNGMITPTTNCNVQKDQRCCGGDDSLQAQQEFAKTSTYNFVANEQDMYEAMDLENYRYVVLLRDSQSRYLSHWQHVCRFNPNNMTTFSDWWSRQPDNWNVRKICGTACMTTPKFGITQDQFDYTRDRLSKFSDILFMEEFNSTFTQFASHVGWTKMPITKGRKKPFVYPSLGHNAWDPLMSALDDALYEYGTQLYHGIHQPVISIQHKQALEKYFALGRMKLCNNPCCSRECSLY